MLEFLISIFTGYFDSCDNRQYGQAPVCEWYVESGMIVMTMHLCASGGEGIMRENERAWHAKGHESGSLRAKLDCVCGEKIINL